MGNYKNKTSISKPSLHNKKDEHGKPLSFLPDSCWQVFTYFCSLLLLFPLFGIHAQVTVKGKVTDFQGKGLPFATVTVKEHNGISTACDINGEFGLKVPSLPIILYINYVGFREMTIGYSTPSEYKTICLKEESLELPGVIVTAQRNISVNGTSAYTVGEQAIKQIQAMSLGDIISLLPGARLKAPSMIDAQQFNARSASSSKLFTANAFGSAVILNGIRLSNDANMQAYNPAYGLWGGKSVVGRGIDLRDISPVGIEQVEVVTGVPSAKYGNIASGTVIVKSKTANHSKSINLSANSTDYQAGFTQGVQIGGKDVLNYDITLSYSNGSAVQKKDYYIAAGLGMRWKRELSKKLNWSNLLSFDGLYSFNGQGFEKEDLFQNKQIARNRSLMLSASGEMDVLQKLNYSFAAGINDQYSYLKERNNNGPLPLVEGLETGTYQSGYSGISYVIEKTVKGRPISLQGNINTSQNVHRGITSLRFDTGLQFQYDKNTGEGLAGLPDVVEASGSLGSREVLFHEVPSSMIWSIYHEIHSTFAISNVMKPHLVTGMRYDYMDRRYHLLSPRLSATFPLLAWLKLRAAWGLSYKAPALIQLYPGPSYIDYMNMGFYPDNRAERMAVVTTHQYIPDNSQLKPMGGKTYEWGFDMHIKNFGELQITCFNKTLDRHIESSPELLFLPLQRYEVVKRYGYRWPDIRPKEGDAATISQIVYRMKNAGKSISKGAEIIFSSEEIKATNTKIDLRISLMATYEYDKGFNLISSQYVVGNEVSRIGIYANPVSKSYLGLGNLTIIQQFPKLGLVFAFTGELNFYDYQKYISPSLYPIAYYTLDGNYHALSPEQAMSAEFIDLKLSKWAYAGNGEPPFYPNFHLTVRKELKRGHTLNFYAHNFLWYNPVYENNGIRRVLNDKISFGFGLTFKL